MTLARPLALAAAAALACAPQPRPQSQAPTDAIPHATATATVGVRPAILAAQLREPTLADLEDGRTIAAVIYVVLSVPVDPVSIDPEHFMVAMDDGRRVRPARVLLSASGVDRQTLTLAIAGPVAPADEATPRAEKRGRGDKPVPEASPDKRRPAGERPVPEASSDKRRPAGERPVPEASSERRGDRRPEDAVDAPPPRPAPRPLALTITGNLFGAGGEALSGLSAEVDAIDRPPRAVHARRLSTGADAQGCEAGAQVVRTTWSAPLAGDVALDLATVSLIGSDGARAHPSAVVGLQLAQGSYQRGDNVVDLCVPEGVGLSRLVIDAGALRDLYGLASAAVDLPIARGARS